MQEKYLVRRGITIMKKIMAVLLAATLVLSTTVFAAGVSDKVRFDLTSLGIMSVDDDFEGNVQRDRKSVV